ncbi:sensor histidine kinase [Plectonema cf. radiosum LEGE 06105]|uniref:histidine kinase n=1 Tax=Plectonema cf. radiosum LEGE 06105 TaxID=945769 RepID=A0A8J7FFH4_9CYAN|nr:sensor histidine kinase [Plectonema radiosum]MBE9215543.1 sensor histidine kinase [Plectonema cf. radiosum LEGE 06105]
MVEELYTPEQLAQMHDSLWQCVLQFANLSAVQERNRIARDLHDSVGHALTGLNFQLQTAIKCQPDPIQVQKFLTEAHRLVAIATQEVRQSVKGLRSDALETQSLEMLIASLVNDFYDSTGILPQVEITERVATPSQLIAPIYRIIQEALNNIRKYARATEVQLDICTTVTQLHLTIQDNGRGFDPEKVSGGYGLQGMQERVAVLQGYLH